jgi:hypothetical protein
VSAWEVIGVGSRVQEVPGGPPRSATAGGFIFTPIAGARIRQVGHDDQVADVALKNAAKPPRTTMFRAVEP